MAKPPFKKICVSSPAEENRDFALLARLPDNGIAQCNLCVTEFSIPGYRTWDGPCSTSPMVNLKNEVEV